MKKIHYSWVVCICGILAIFCSIGMTSTNFSTFIPFLRETYSFSNFMGSTLLSVRLLVGTLSMFFVDRFLKAIGASKCIFVGIVCQMSGYGLWALAGPRYYLYLIGAALNGMGSTLGCIVVVSTLINKWFKKRQALALSICLAGSSICAFIMPGITTRIIESYSISIAVLMDVSLMAVILFILLLFLKNSPEEKGLSAYCPENLQEKTVSVAGGNAPVRTLVPLGAAMFLSGFASNFASGQIANLYRNSGMDAITVSRIISFYGVFLFFGKLIFGQFSDKKGCHKANTLFSLVLAVAYLSELLVFTRSLVLAIFTQLLVGIGLPVTTIGVTNIVRSCYPAENYTRYSKTQQAIFYLGGVFSGIVPGWLADITGSYIPGSVLACVSIITWWVITNKIYKQA